MDLFRCSKGIITDILQSKKVTEAMMMEKRSETITEKDASPPNENDTSQKRYFYIERFFLLKFIYQNKRLCSSNCFA